MLFNSVDFAIFLPVVFLIYWFGTGRNYRYQNLFILLSSYVFYGWWDWRYLGLLMFSTLLDYLVGIGLSKTDKTTHRKWLVALSITLNLSLLGIYKYLNFFIENFVAAFSLFGMEIPVDSVDLILPIGISFYTFQTMSYTIDVYKRKIEPTRDLLAFASFVSFFPQLVAGPIERATQLLPQFQKQRVFEYSKAVDGLRQILWGLFKKVVIADSCGSYVDMAFDNPEGYTASTLLFAVLLFPTQVYCDFSGYSDIAIGTARLFGINLNRNFAFPFYSLTVPEFWRRWHISLYTWFRDYIHLPYIFSAAKKNKWVMVKATFITSSLIGFWHGADWTFVLWGLMNGIYLTIPLLMRKNKKKMEYVPVHIMIPTLTQVLRMNLVFFQIALAAILFRVDGMSDAAIYFTELFGNDLLTFPQEIQPEFIMLLIFFHLKEWTGRGGQFGIQLTGMNWPRPLRLAFYIFIIFLTGMYMQTYENPFIYFNF